MIVKNSLKYLFHLPKKAPFSTNTPRSLNHFERAILIYASGIAGASILLLATASYQMFKNSSSKNIKPKEIKDDSCKEALEQYYKKRFDLLNEKENKLNSRLAQLNEYNALLDKRINDAREKKEEEALYQPKISSR